MAYWIFTVKNQKKEQYSLTGQQIYQQRMKDRFWGLHDRTPNKNKLAKGDRVVFYIGYPKSVFSGTATLATPYINLSEEQKQKYVHDNLILNSETGVELKDIDIWEIPKPVSSLVANLKFIENKEFWGTYFQGGIRGLLEKDYALIVASKLERFDESLNSKEEIESAAQFALESHLEEFMHKNWNRIEKFQNLNLYQSEDSDGRQFPAGTWSIDFLAIEKTTNDLIVIELKRGQTSDTTVGQVLRYVGWIRENVAEENQNVRGLVICREIDDALKYAVKSIPHISIMTYKVNFSLEEIKI